MAVFFVRLSASPLTPLTPGVCHKTAAFNNMKAYCFVGWLVCTHFKSYEFDFFEFVFDRVRVCVVTYFVH